MLLQKEKEAEELSKNKREVSPPCVKSYGDCATEGPYPSLLSSSLLFCQSTKGASECFHSLYIDFPVVAELLCGGRS